MKKEVCWPQKYAKNTRHGAREGAPTTYSERQRGKCARDILAVKRSYPPVCARGVSEHGRASARPPELDVRKWKV